MIILLRIAMRWSAQEGVQAAYHLILPVFPFLAGLSLFRVNPELSPRKWTILMASGSVIALTLIHLILIRKEYHSFLTDGIYVWSHLLILPIWFGLPALGISFLAGLIVDYIRNYNLSLKRTA